VKVMKIPKTLTVDNLLRLYRSGSVTPYEVIDEIIKRVNKASEYHIWITPPDISLCKPYIDALPSDKRLPLWGVPFAVKDNIDLAGAMTTAGCPAYAYTPQRSAAVVEALINAGAIPIGKTNMDQFATGLVGTRSPYGEAKNAYNPDLISGGSSSGSAVAVALGMAAFSLGTDTAGSGRVPALLNNLVGYKPPLGAYDKRGVVPACESLDCVSIFAHSISDCGRVDLLLRKRSGRSAKLEKIFIIDEAIEFFGEYPNEYRSAWEKSIDRIRSMGTEVDTIDGRIFRDAAKLLYDGPYVAERMSAVGDFIMEHGSDIFPVTREIITPKREPTARELFDAMAKMAEYKRRVHSIIENGVVIMPTAAGTFKRSDVSSEPITTNSMMGRYTNHCNLLDLAAVALPTIFAADHLPFGVTAFSKGDEENLLFAFANLVEEEFSDTMQIAVCGLHKRGGALEWQLTESGGKFIREAETAAMYEMYKLEGDKPKPGLVRRSHSVESGITVEIWSVQTSKLGQLIRRVPLPLAIGQIELSDGQNVAGFICENYAVEKAENITSIKSWRNL
jgi:allophanate hydrolase